MALLVLGCNSCNGKVTGTRPAPSATAAAGDAAEARDSGGDGTDAAVELPLPALGTGPTIACGLRHACGIRRNGTLACWYGNFPPSDSSESDMVLAVPSGKFAAVGVGDDFACAVHPDGKVTCWGFASTYMHGWQPARPAAALAVCSSRVCTLDAAGTPSGYDYACPVSNGDGPFTQVDCACGLTRDGAIDCAANQTFKSFPPPPAGHDFVQLSTGETFHCALHRDGRIVCWGIEDPRPPDGTYLSISVGDSYACAIRDDHRVVCFAGPSLKSLDFGTMFTPPPDPFAQIAAGTTFACGITLGGAAKCWGWHPQDMPADFP